MGRLDPARQRLAAARAGYERVAQATASWSDQARRNYEARVGTPLVEALRRYEAALADIDVTLDRALALLRG